MSTAPVLFTQFRRINAHPGLMVDADVWTDAHQYHRQQLHLHHLALHGWGVVQGLEVSLVPGADNMLRVEPGLAIDPAGHFLVVSEAHMYQVTTREAGTAYLVLQFREVLAEPASPTPSNRATPPTRIIDAYRIQERDQLPDEPYLELARVERDPGRGNISAAHNPDAPGPNELDLRARVHLGSAPVPVIAPPPPPSAAPDGTLEPRFDVLAEQIRMLGARVSALSERAAEPSEAKPDQPQRRHSEPPPPDGRVDELVARVTDIARQLAELERQAVAPSTIESLQLELTAVRDQVGAVLNQPPGTSVEPERRRLRLAVAQHGGQSWQMHQAGLRFMAHELGYATELIGEALEPISAADPSGVDVLYLSGNGALALQDDEVDGISRLLAAGGLVIGEACATGPAGEEGARDFAMAYVELGNRLGRRLTKVDRTHPMMTARYVFGEPPVGARASPRLLEGDGMIYSDADYGCAWQGGAADRPLARAIIRDALEFGVNLAVYRSGLTAS